MKLKPEIIYQILLYLEDTIKDTEQLDRYSLEEHLAERCLETSSAISYHITYLKDSYLIKIVNNGVGGLTPEGHAYLDFIRDNSKNGKIILPRLHDFNSNTEDSISINIGSIGNVNGSNLFIGKGHQNISVAVDLSFSELHRLIDETPNIDFEDKAELQELTNTVEKIIEENEPIKGGILSKFANLAERYAPIVGSVLHPLTAWILGK